MAAGAHRPLKRKRKANPRMGVEYAGGEARKGKSRWKAGERNPAELGRMGWLTGIIV